MDFKALCDEEGINSSAQISLTQGVDSVAD